MADPHDISGEPNYMVKLGKLPVLIKAKTIQFSDVRKKVLPPIPDKFDVEKAFPNLTFPYGNGYGNIDEGNEKAVGDCVVVMKLRQLLVFEGREQGKIIPVTKQDARNQYFSETGGKDNGLVMLNALDEWRQTGFRIGGRKLLCLAWGGELYKIHGYAKLDQTKQEEVKASIALLYGVACGLMLPLTGQDQWNAGKPWEYIDKAGNEPGSWGGHGVYLLAYYLINGKLYLDCFSWGKRQAISWDFFLHYSDEDYAIIDEKDNPDSPIDPDLMEPILDEITK